MPAKRKLLRKPAKRRMGNRTKRSTPATSRDSGLSQRLNDLTEQIDIMVPEMSARIAALEHLLLEKLLCTREDLIRSREFVRILED